MPRFSDADSGLESSPSLALSRVGFGAPGVRRTTVRRGPLLGKGLMGAWRYAESNPPQVITSGRRAIVPTHTQATILRGAPRAWRRFGSLDRPPALSEELLVARMAEGAKIAIVEFRSTRRARKPLFAPPEGFSRLRIASPSALDWSWHGVALEHRLPGGESFGERIPQSMASAQEKNAHFPLFQNRSHSRRNCAVRPRACVVEPRIFLE